MIKFISGTMAHRIRWEARADRLPNSGELLCMIEILQLVREGLLEGEAAHARWLMSLDQDRMTSEGGRA